LYKDYNIIDEQTLVKLNNAYNEKYFKTNILKNDNINENVNFFENIKVCLENLFKAKYYILNLIKTSKNLEQLDFFQKIETNLQQNYDNLLNLYDLNLVFKNNNITTNYTYNENLKNTLNCLLNSIENLFTVLTIETNIKIKSILNSIIFNILNITKEINCQFATIKNYKIFSIFKKYN